MSEPVIEEVQVVHDLLRTAYVRSSNANASFKVDPDTERDVRRALEIMASLPQTDATDAGRMAYVRGQSVADSIVSSGAIELTNGPIGELLVHVASASDLSECAATGVSIFEMSLSHQLIAHTLLSSAF